MKKLGILVTPLVVISLLASCGGGDNPGPTPTPTVVHNLVYVYDNETGKTFTEKYIDDEKTKEPTWTPTYDGHTFVGWYEEEGEGEEGTEFTFGSALTSKETTIHAHWSVAPVPKTTYHLTFNGTNCKMNGTDKYEEDIPIGATTQRAIYPNEGYALPVLGKGKELTIEGEGAQSVSYKDGNIIITKFSGDVKITANPSLKDCIVKFNANGGKLVGDSTTTVPYGKKFSAITDLASHKAEKDLCLFNGWALTPSDKNPLNADNDYDIKDDLEVYAILVPQSTVKLTFNGTNCRLYKDNILQEGTIDIIYGMDNVFTIEPDGSYLPVFLNPVTSTNTLKCEYDPATKQLIIMANHDCTVTASTFKQTLEECTWGEIESISEAGIADGFFDIGETKTVKLIENGTEQSSPHTVRIIGFNHDYSELLDDGSEPDPSKKLGITFEFADVICNSDGLAITKEWNIEQEASSTNYDYRDSTLNIFLNDTGDDGSVINMLPSDPVNKDLREVIKPVDKKVGVRATIEDEYIATSFDGTTYPYPYLFPLAHDEIAEHERYVAGDEGSKYQYYVEHPNDADRIKARVERDNGERYWLRSPYAYTNQNDCVWWINMYGKTEFSGPINEAYAIAPAFCI